MVLYREPGFAVTVSNVYMNREVIVTVKQKAEAKYSKDLRHG